MAARSSSNTNYISKYIHKNKICYYYIQYHSPNVYIQLWLNSPACDAHWTAEINWIIQTFHIFHRCLWFTHRTYTFIYQALCNRTAFGFGLHRKYGIVDHHNEHTRKTEINQLLKHDQFSLWYVQLKLGLFDLILYVDRLSATECASANRFFDLFASGMTVQSITAHIECLLLLLVACLLVWCAARCCSYGVCRTQNGVRADVTLTYSSTPQKINLLFIG